MRLMEFPASFPRPAKPPKSFTRSELIRSIYERFQRNLGEEDRPRLRRRAQAESLVIAVLDEIAGALERGMRVDCAASAYSASNKRVNGKGVIRVPAKRW